MDRGRPGIAWVLEVELALRSKPAAAVFERGGAGMGGAVVSGGNDGSGFSGGLYGKRLG
jgi:hypothetical protein